MPQTRYKTEVYYPSHIPYANRVLSHPEVIITKIPYTVSDEELTEEAEVKGIITMIDNLPNQGINVIFKRLLKKGLLS